MKRIPSVKALKQITSYPRELRKILECSQRAQLEEWLAVTPPLKPFGVRSAFNGFKLYGAYMDAGTTHYLSTRYLKMLMANELCETYGVESIYGTDNRSPAIEYLNAGDTYTATLLYVCGSYRVGCWGDIVERGNYE